MKGVLLTVTQYRESDDWNVWVQLAPGNPTHQCESFVIGVGETREEAIADAILELDATIKKLHESADLPFRRIY